MSTANYIKNVAIVGAAGRSGGYMVKYLLETGKHTVTALSREGSKVELPAGIKVKRINYDNPSTIVEALRGQDALIITLGVTAPRDTQSKLIHAAGEAGVPWILPNGYGPDSAGGGPSAGLVRDVSVFQEKVRARKLIKELGKSSFIDVHTGFWYEWSLAFPQSYGFDFEKREVTLFDEGETKISTSTWPQTGRAVATLLSLPIQPDPKGNREASLEHFRNGFVYVSSFRVSQKDMLDSVLRVTGTKKEDWAIRKESSSERFEAGKEALSKGDRMGFSKLLYARVFYPDGNGDFETTRGLHNELLRLPKEDLDEATRAGIERSKNPWQ